VDRAVLVMVLVNVIMGYVATPTLSMGEEIGWRGYLLPHLLRLGRTWALALSGLVWAMWYMPGQLFGPGMLFVEGRSLADVAFGGKLIFVLLFAGGFVVLGFFFGYLRLYTNSVWPTSLAALRWQRLSGWGGGRS